MEGLATCTRRLKLKKNQKGHSKRYANNWNYLELRDRTKFKIEIDDWLLKIGENFVFNIPSDYYRLLNPKKIFYS